MTDEETSRIRVLCTQCTFSKTVSTSGDPLPAEVLREHGLETGHQLRLEPLDD